jgi:hypothetical protein
MRGVMKSLVPALLLALGACGHLTTGTDTADRPIAKSPSGQLTSSQQTQRLQEQGVSGTPRPNTPSEPLNTGASEKPLVIDTTKRFEYADVYTDLGDPTGQRELVRYLLKPEVWTLIKCEMLSDTSKHYRFQKLTSGEGRVMPEVDIFKGRR